MDQFYFEEGYLEPSYFTVIREAEVLFAVTVTLSALVDIADATGYYIPDYIVTDYFVSGGQVREADAAFTVSASQSVVFERITQAAVTVSVTVTKVCTVTRIRDSEAAFTAAFAPTLTADAFKNHTAVLDSVSTMSVDAVANRSANVLLEHIADLNAMAAKRAVSSATMAASATQTTSAQTTSSISLTLSTTVTVVSEVLSVQFGQAALQTRATLFASRYLGSGRPINLVSGTATFNNSIRKFGTASLDGSLSSGGRPKLALLPTPTSNFYYEGWFYPQAGNLSQVFFTVSSFTIIDLVSGRLRYRLQRQNPNNPDGIVSFTSYQTPDQLAINTWHHWSMVRTGSVISFYLNGTRVFTQPGVESVPWGTQQTSGYFVSVGTNGLNILVDEVFASNQSSLTNDAAQTTITVPTAERINDPATTTFLYHLNNSSLDDIGVAHFGQANLLATTSLTAAANANTKQASADLVTTVTVSVLAGKPQTASAEFVSATTQVTTADRLAEFASALSVSASQSAIIGSIKQFETNTLSGFTSNIEIIAQLAGVALLETTTLLETQAVKTTDAVSNQTATADQTASITYTAGADLAVTVTADQTATATRIQTAAAVLESVASQVVEIDAINRVSADLVSVFAQTTQVVRQRPGTAELSTAVELDAIIEFTHNSTVVIDTTVVQTAINDRIRPADVTASVLTELTANAVKDTDVVSVQSVQAVLTSSAVKTTDVLVDKLVLFTSSFSADITARPLVFLESQFGLVSTVGVIKPFSTVGINTGLQITAEYGVTLLSQPFFGLKVRDNGFTASQWVKRETNLGLGLEQIWGSLGGGGGGGGGGGENTGSLCFQDTNMLLRFNYDADEPNPTWTNVAPLDGEWHHYVIRGVTVLNQFGPSQPGPVNRWQLWIDGVYQGLSSGYFAAGQITFFDQTPFNNQPQPAVLVGRGNALPIPWPGSNPVSSLVGAMAQLWMGYTGDDIDINDFYSDFQDFGDDGTRGGRLPAPNVYNRLTAPWTGVIESGQPIQSGQAAAELLEFPRITALFTVQAIPNAVSLVALSPQAEFTQVTAITYRVDLNEQFDVSSDLTALAITQIGILSDQQAQFDINAVINKTAGYQADLSVQATVTAQAGFFDSLSADIASQFELTADFDAVPPTRGEAELAGSFALTAAVTSFTDSFTELQVQSTLTADVTVIPPIRAQADLVVTASMTVTIGAIEQFAVLVASAGEMTIAANITASASSDLDLVATINSEAIKFTGAVVNISALAFQLTAGDVINLDPALTYVIPQETREFQILAELREYPIASETRELIILKG